jgi:hypothetical protein
VKKRKFGLSIDRDWDAAPLSDDDRRQRECGSKELRTETDAKTQAQLNTSRGNPMAAYKCSFCAYWHIGGRR